MKRFSESPIAKTLDMMGGVFGDFYRSLSLEDRKFVKEQIAHFHSDVQKILIRKYQSFDKPFNANTYLRNMSEKLNALLPEKIIPYFDAGENELRELAEENSQRCMRFEINSLNNSDIRNVTGNSPVNGNVALYNLNAEFVNGFGINPPEVSKSVTLTGALKRMQDKYWWLRKLRKVIARKREAVLIHLGQVNSRKGKYCSDYTVEYRLIQKDLQRKMLENLVIVNEKNESFSLAELSDKNVSNPVNRKNELMTRMAGYEKIAKELNHKSLFVTITCPSRFHNTYAKSGDPNPKWDGSTPYDAQQYLNDLWALVRAELNRKEIKVYGFRIAEPQHDGTPHWHMLIFVQQEQAEQFKAIIEHYALREDGDEAGAIENRCDFKDIDYSRGSATGYIAKYVSKNVNGANLDSDIDGGNAIEASQRVEAWASCWGIRQFQQIGAGSVTVWRELRRLKELLGENESFSKIHDAADKGAWAEFVTLMGGVFCKRDEQPIRPLYKEKVDTDTGELKQNFFDGVVSISLRGVKLGEKELITRIHEWRVENRGTRAA
ncbi:replication endonuclease [Alteromonas stellipolaris]|uniref:replication endonuclease n=1 Tax=Alteromonas stellipolaris TaxID=233316 RepID=UPI002734631A|nr:replication endonuclease [Alteromonas stellipolaris]MDP2596623.1 replication endonuclease [Alteromonas stellipolaris]